MRRIFLGCVLSLSTSFADLKGDLSGFFDRLGMNSNVTEAGSFKDQAAGYYTGGSIVARSKPRNIQLATIQLPSIKAGCGGIDMFNGAFSFIQKEELVNALRAIGSNAGSYAFMLSLQSMSPQLYNTINELNNLAQKINSMNINSCETAATMVGSVWPKSEAASEHVCKSIASSSGMFKDYAAAKHECNSGGKRNDVLSKKDGSGYKNTLVGEYNIAWKVIKDLSFIGNDKDLAQMFLTLTGSIISKNSGDSKTVVSLPSLAHQADVTSALLEGGETTMYACDTDDKCLNPTKLTKTFAIDSSFKSKVQKILSEMVDKIYDETALSNEEKSFLNTTRLPVYKILNVLTSFKKGGGAIDVLEYADVIAIDIVLSYIMECLDTVHQNLSTLKTSQVDDTQINKFQKDLMMARSQITEKRTAIFQHLSAVLSMIQKTKQVEQSLHGAFTMAEENS